MTVTLWRGNRLDQEEQWEPSDLASRFIDRLLADDYEPCVNRGLDYAYRWWLTDGKEANLTWEEDDWVMIVEALATRLRADDALYERVMERIWVH